MKGCFSFLVSILFLLPTGTATAEDGVAIVEFIVRHNARAQQAREAADAGYFQRVLQNAKVTGTLTEKYFNGTDKDTTDYTTTTDTTKAGTTAAITLSVPLLDSREARERTTDMLKTIQTIRETALIQPASGETGGGPEPGQSDQRACGIRRLAPAAGRCRR
jgi:hypothetical protein